jgi:hypothetical protein
MARRAWKMNAALKVAGTPVATKSMIHAYS